MKVWLIERYTNNVLRGRRLVSTRDEAKRWVERYRAEGWDTSPRWVKLTNPDMSHEQATSMRLSVAWRRIQSDRRAADTVRTYVTTGGYNAGQWSTVSANYRT